MRRVLLLSAFALSLAGIAMAQQTGTQAYSEGSQFGQYAPYEQYNPYTSQYNWQYTPYSEQYSPYMTQRGQFSGRYAPYSGWEYGSEQYSQTPYQGTGFGWQGEYPGWTGTYRPYGFAGYGNFINWNQPGQMAEQQGMFGRPWSYGQAGFGEAYGWPSFRTMTPWQGQHIRVVGAIQQQMPAEHFSSELNPNDVLVTVHTFTGRDQLVDLGPGAEAANFAPSVGTRVLVSGHITFLNGQPVLIAQRAHELGAGMFQQAGFGESGTFPYGFGWSGQESCSSTDSAQGQRVRVMGTIQQYIPAQQFSNALNPNDALVSVRTFSGRDQLVDLGPGADAATFTPTLGARVLVSGHITCLNGQPVLIAQRAHELGTGMFRQAGYGERSMRFRQPSFGRTNAWQSTERSDISSW
jgi:hypothetical protein